MRIPTSCASDARRAIPFAISSTVAATSSIDAAFASPCAVMSATDEFIADAERHDLQFVGEASANELPAGKYSAEVMRKMDELKGAKEVVREQYKDFIRGSGFRQTLLCRNEIELAPDLLLERVPQLYASCDAAPQENSGDAEGEEKPLRPPTPANVRPPRRNTSVT